MTHPLEITFAPAHPLTGNFRALDAHRDAPHHHYADLLEADARMRGRVLDIGCGADFPRFERVRTLLQRCAQLDGVEPDPGVVDHPGLTERWCAPFEDADVPSHAYDALFTFWVLEHIRHAEPFMRKAREALRDGGVVYGFTPNALHPFAVLSRTIQALNLKSRWRKGTSHKINDYPAYYRLNRAGHVIKAARAAGFRKVEFHYVPCINWDRYVPRPLRFGAHVYDRLIGTRVRKAGQVFIFRAEA